MKKLTVIVALCAILLSEPVLAQSSSDEIVVTGTRLQRYSQEDIPLITLTRKADFVLLDISVVNDTRDNKMRGNELRKTVLSLVKAAEKRDDLFLSVLKVIEDDYEEISFPVPFTKDMIDDQTTNGYRVDTSRVDIVIKTPILESDMGIEAPYARIIKFYESIRLDGRSTFVENEEPVLSIKNIEKYRTALLTDIKKDVTVHQKLLGGDGETRIMGLENSLRWVRQGELDLKIYVPYKLSYGVE